jgi:hypothetical protein
MDADIAKFSEPSFYPSHGDNTHPLASLEHRSQEFGLNNDDSNTESNEDLADESHLAELAQGVPGRISEAIAMEVCLQCSVCVWK